MVTGPLIYQQYLESSLNFVFNPFRANTNICMTFLQCLTNVVEVGLTLYKCNVQRLTPCHVK